MASAYDRVMDKVHFVPECGCWLFAGATTSHGYGIVSSRHGEAPLSAHRVTFEEHHGPVPDGMVVRHKCDTRRCVNPSHLEPGSQQENVRDIFARKRNNPNSLKNLRPGAPGCLGAGPKVES